MKATYIDHLATWEKEFKFHVSVQVRFSETDMFGHLNNTVPFVYFEFARIEFFKTLGDKMDWLHPKGKTIPVVADLQCDFLQQVFFDEKLKVYVKVASIGKSSIDLHYMTKNEREEIVFTGRGSIVQVNKITGKASAWTTEEKKALFTGTVQTASS